MSVRRLARNLRGKDYAIGDIHSHPARVRSLLHILGFDPAVDRLIAAGDLFDRGPDPAGMLSLLDEPWFYAVLGNHDELAIRLTTGNLDIERYIKGGGGWNVLNPRHIRQRYADYLSKLPLAIEVETGEGKVGIVHAGCPLPTWAEFTAACENPLSCTSIEGGVKHGALWMRDRIKRKDETLIPDVRAVIAGHCTVKVPTVLGNVIHIDTGGWTPTGYFTFVELETLEVIKEERG